MATRSKDEIAIDLLTNILREEPKADVMPGQVLRDVAVNAPAVEMENLYNQVNRIGVSQSISNALFMTTDELDNLLSNYGIKRRGATKAIGDVVFYTSVLPNEVVTISKGTTLGTNLSAGGKEVIFETRSDIIFDPSPTNEAALWNTTFKRWEIPGQVISQQGGAEGNVGPYTLTKVRNANIPFQVTNTNATAGGVSQESNETFAVRALNIILGSNVGTETGYQGLALQQDGVLDALIIGPGDDLMTRDGGFGGKVDIWTVPAETSILAIDSDTEPSLFIENWDAGDQLNNSNRFNFPKKPMVADANIDLIASTAPSGTLANAVLYEYRSPAPDDVEYVNPSGARYHYRVFKADDLNTAHSIYANDYIEWNLSEMDYLRQYDPSGTSFSGNTMDVNISYSYDSSVTDLQDTLDDPDNKIITADVLAKEAQKIQLDVYMEVELTADAKETVATENVTLANIEDALAVTINNTTLGNKVELSDLVQSAHNVSGVDNVILGTLLLTRKRPVYFDDETESIIDDEALENQYFESDVLTIKSV